MHGTKRFIRMLQFFALNQTADEVQVCLWTISSLVEMKKFKLYMSDNVIPTFLIVKRKMCAWFGTICSALASNGSFFTVPEPKLPSWVGSAPQLVMDNYFTTVRVQFNELIQVSSCRSSIAVLSFPLLPCFKFLFVILFCFRLAFSGTVTGGSFIRLGPGSCSVLESQAGDEFSIERPLFAPSVETGTRSFTFWEASLPFSLGRSLDLLLPLPVASFLLLASSETDIIFTSFKIHIKEN